MIVKRTFDLLLSLGLLIVLLPLLLAIALYVKLDSAGPALFRQTRVGRGGREFMMLKFRTMRPDAESAGPQITVGADARITRAGRLLRASKLDELPQLINVLVGDMSFVGPRPEVPRYVAQYPSDVRELVLSVRPGITDPASIRFRDESELLAGVQDPELHYRREIMPMKLAMYAQYVRERDFWTDLKIILATIFAVTVGRRGS